MKTHFLHKLPIALPPGLPADLDLYRASVVRKLVVEYEMDDDGLPAVEIVLKYRSEPHAEITLRLEGVRQLLLPEMTPMLQLVELEIEDVRERGLEGVRFEVVSEFSGAFRCLCRSIRVISFG